MQVVLARGCFDDTKVTLHTFPLHVDFKIEDVVTYFFPLVNATEVLCFRALS